MKKVEADSKLNLVHQCMYYDNMNAMQLGLESKSIDEMSTYKSVADYLIVRKPGLSIVTEHKLQNS